MNSELFKQYQEYLLQRRRAILTELDEIERQLGLSPTTAELRRREKEKENASVVKSSDVVIE